MITTDFKDEPKSEAWAEAQRIGETLAAKTSEALLDSVAVTDPKIDFTRKTFRVPLENPNFKLLVKMGVLPKISDSDDLSSIETEVSRVTIGPAEFITMPGEVLPSIGIFLRKQMTGNVRFQLGLTCDALGYILTPEDFVQSLYRYESSVSVGSRMGRIMEDNLLELIRPR